MDNANENGGHPPIPMDREFLRVINIGGNIRMGTWVLRPYFPNVGEVTNMRYSELDAELRKRGPLRPLPEQLSRTALRTVKTFTEKTMLIAPPIVVQERRKPGSCSMAFSDRVLVAVVDRGDDHQCSYPYECLDYSTTKVYKCPGDAEDGRFFGMEPIVFEDRTVYVEYLASIADYSILVRDGKLLSTGSFLDTLTSRVSIMAIFYSVEFGITSMLRIDFETARGRVLSSMDLRHYVTLSDEDKNECTMLAIVVGIVLTISLLESLHALRVLFHQWKDTNHFRKRELFNTVLSWSVWISSIWFVILIFSDKSKSAENTEALVGDLMDIQWKGSRTNYSQKKREFLGIFQDVFALINHSERLQTMGIFVMLAIMMLVLMATSSHPRIALITNTFFFSMNNLFHFMILFIVIFFGFAVIATWRFGSTRPELGDLWASLRSQLDTLLGPPGLYEVGSKEAGDSIEYFFFIVSFHFVCFFLMLNFFLAIIVDAYEQVQAHNEELATEQDLVSDTVDIICRVCLAIRYHWPRHYRIINLLKSLDLKYVNAPDLLDAGFRSIPDAEAYFHFYQRFDPLVKEEKVDTSLEDVANSQMIALNRMEQLQKRAHGRLELEAATPVVQEEVPMLEEELTKEIPSARFVPTHEQLMGAIVPSPHLARRSI